MSAIATPIRNSRRPDEKILAEVLRSITSEWFYDFTNENNEDVFGISAVGASEYARIRGDFGYPIRFTAAGVSVGEVRRAGEAGVQATVIARDIVAGSEGIGYAFYPNYVGRKEDRERDNFNDRIAVSVAKRNAILDLVPEAHLNIMLKAKRGVARANEKRIDKERRDAIKQLRESAPPPETVTLKKGERILTADPYDHPSKLVSSETPLNPEDLL